MKEYAVGSLSKGRKAKKRKHRGFRRKESLIWTCGIYFVFIALILVFGKGGTSTAVRSHSSQFRLLSNTSNASNASNCSVPTSFPHTFCDEKTIQFGPLYPKDVFSMAELRGGAVVLHVLLMIQTFFGLSMICDAYFENALESICEDLSLTDDVAGATFMAAGGSAPELFTSFMGVFVAVNDIGVGTIVGSAVFNVLFVIALCAFMAPNLALTWWPLCRDCVYYCFSIICLVLVVIDNQVHWYEALILLCCYFLYVTIMKFNHQLESWVTKKVNQDLNKPKSQGQRIMFAFVESYTFMYLIYAVIFFNIVITFIDLSSATTTTLWLKLANDICAIIFIVEYIIKSYAYGFFGFWTDAMNAFDGILVFLIVVEYGMSSNNVVGILRGAKVFRFMKLARVLRLVRLWRMMHKDYAEVGTQTESDESKIVPDPVNGKIMVISMARKSSRIPGEARMHDVRPASSTFGNKVMPSGDEDEKSKFTVGEKTEPTISSITPTSQAARNSPPPSSTPHNSGHEDDDDDSDDEDDGPVPCPLFDIPSRFEDEDDDDEEEEGDNKGREAKNPLVWIAEVLWWFFTMPLACIIWATVPDLNLEKNEKLYPLTFGLSIAWITILSFGMVWMSEIFGYVTGIDPPVMGVTILAAGTSIPDALSSIAVAVRGHGDMAVSSSVGSNIFDILIGLPVPWLVKTLFVCGTNCTVKIYSDNISILILTLFIMVASVICIIHVSGWALTKRLGYAMLFLYCIFVVEALALEYKWIVL